MSPVHLTHRILKDMLSRRAGRNLYTSKSRDAFEALMAAEDHVVAGSFKNKVQATVSHVLPDTETAQMHRKEAEPGSANK